MNLSDQESLINMNNSLDTVKEYTTTITLTTLTIVPCGATGGGSGAAVGMLFGPAGAALGFSIGLIGGALFSIVKLGPFIHKHVTK